MNYEDLSKGKKIWYGITAWVLLAVTTAGVWYVFFTSVNRPKELLVKALSPEAARIVTVCIRTLLVLFTGVLVTGISETMTRIKRCLNERVMCTAIVTGLMLALDMESFSCIYNDHDVFRYLHTMVAVLLFMWVYLREIPYDCFGSREPWLFVTAWIIPVGFVAGFGNRSLGVVVIGFAVATIIYVNKVGHRAFAWMPLGAISAFLGVVARFFLPVYYTKNFMSIVKVYEEAASLLDNGVSDTIYGIFFELAPAILVTLVVVALLKGVHNVPLGPEVVYVLVAATAATVFSMLIPHRFTECMYPTIVLLVLACAAMCLKLFEKRPAMKLFVYIGSGYLWLRMIALVVENTL